MASNGSFFRVVPVAPLGAAGYEVRVLDPRDFTTVIAVINDYSQLMIGPELNGPGLGSISMDADSPFWRTTLPNGHAATTILDYECLWQVREDGEVRFEWLGTNVEERLLEDGETRGISVSGQGSAQVLGWGCILRPGFPAPARDGPLATTSPGRLTGGYNWQFPVTWSAMRIWLHLLRECQARGTIPWVTPMFTANADSGGRAWEIVRTPNTVADPGDGIRPEQGTTMLELLNIQTGQDNTKFEAMRAEWVMYPGFKLHVRKVIGQHREKQVIFFEGGMEEKSRTRTREQIANYMVTIDVNGETSLAADSTSMTHWNKREMLQNQNQNITNPARRNALSQVFLQQHKDEQDQWVIQVPYDQAGRRIFVDYDLGDWIGVSTFTAAGESSVTPYRVVALTVTVQEGVPKLELHLNSTLETRQRDLERSVTAIINAIGNQGPENTHSTVPGLPGSPGRDGPYTPGTDYNFPNDPSNSGTNRGDGVKVFIQDTDPGNAARPGDFWYNTAYTPATQPEYEPDPDPEPELTPGEQHMELEGHPLR